MALPNNTSPEWDKPPQVAPAPVKNDKGWSPKLNPTQQKIFDTSAKYVLSSGAKGGGKSLGSIEALVRHCWENKNAFALIIALSIRVGKEGVLYDLENLVLPAWRDGNKYPEWKNGKPHPKAGQYMDEGMGLQFTPSKQDPDTKDRILWIANRHGGWSKVMLVSVPYAAAVEPRMKGLAPSFVYVEEITNCESDDYFKIPSAQLGRRREIDGPQQFYASCNPAGPSHWVYQTWWVNCRNQDTGLRDHDFEVYNVPISENIDNLPLGYVERLGQLFKDPIERRRLMDGEWVDRPSGNSIFKDYFIPELHQLGDALKGIGWNPIKGFPIVVSYDPGPVNFSITFLQRVTTKEKTLWVVFDELNFVSVPTPYPVVVRRLLMRMEYWNKLLDNTFTFVHIAPDDAFNQVRTDGSYDSLKIEELALGKIKMRGCPQAKQSVAQRVHMVTDALLDNSLYISATCTKTLDMMRMLASKRVKPGDYDPNAGLQPMRSIYLHSFDSMTYGMFYFNLLPGRYALGMQRDGTPQAYSCGQAA